jgi:hypothetical protein
VLLRARLQFLQPVQFVETNGLIHDSRSLSGNIWCEAQRRRPGNPAPWRNHGWSRVPQKRDQEENTGTTHPLIRAIHGRVNRFTPPRLSFPRVWAHTLAVNFSPGRSAYSTAWPCWNHVAAVGRVHRDPQSSGCSIDST